MTDGQSDTHRRRKRNLQCKKFTKMYRRVEREYTTFGEEYITDELRQFLRGKEPANVPNPQYLAANEVPVSGFVFLHSVVLNETIHRLNPIVLFRMLNLMYGDPDILGSWFSMPEDRHSPAKGIGGFDVDWGYSFRVGKLMIGEIRSALGNNRFELRFWADESLDQSEYEERLRQDMAKCRSTLNADLECNVHLFDESEDLKDEKRTRHVLTTNVFALHYHSARKLRKLGEDHWETPEAEMLAYAPVQEIDSKDLFTVDFLFLSAALHLVVSLEAFVNAIYHALTKEEFRHRPFNRATFEADWGLRLLTMHLYCRGFVGPTLSPESDLWSRFERLRKFRNQKVHGNISEEHEGY